MGNFFMSGGNDGLLKIYDVASMRESHVIKAPQLKPITALCFINNINDEIAFTSTDKQIRLCKFNYSSQLDSTASGHLDEVTCLTGSKSAGWLISGSLDRTIKFWDLGKGMQQVNKIQASSSILTTDVAESGNLIFSGHKDGSVRIWGLRERNLVK